MKKPIVAIVGRPNVGKSTLFNRIVGDRVSIVDDTPGVTRDRIYRDAEWLKYKFTLIDTGGIEFKTNDDMFKNMRIQTELAIETADVIIFIVDGKTGLVDGDREVARMLRKSKKDIILVVNKIDSKKDEMNLYEFYEFGLGEPIPISSTQSLGLGDMLDEVVKYFDVVEEENEEDDVIKIAVVGKPNVGKSSLINKILGQTRSIVSDVAGTTRDSIDTYFENETEKFILIDTAGLRKKSKIKENVEHYSVIRSLYSIDRCDVCILVIDATQGVTEQDEKIAGIAHEAGKGVIIVINKWDLIEKETNTMEKYKKQVYAKLAYLSYAPIIFISALTGQRVDKIFDMINEVNKQNSQRIPTGLLNDVLAEAVTITQPPSDKGRRLKVYYMTQVSIRPPTFVIFVNSKKLMHFSYVRYLENHLRKQFGFKGTPIHMIIRERKSDEK